MRGRRAVGASWLPRSIGFALACTGLAAAAHSLGHGWAPPVPVLAAAAGGLTFLTAPFATRDRPLPVVLAAMVAVQAGLHVLFAATANTSGRMYAALESGLCIADRAALPDAAVRHMVRMQARLLPAPHAMPLAPWHTTPTMLGGHLAAVAVMTASARRPPRPPLTSKDLPPWMQTCHPDISPRRLSHPPNPSCRPGASHPETSPARPGRGRSGTSDARTSQPGTGRRGSIGTAAAAAGAAPSRPPWPR
ncbi:membrane hypothetical protein [Frankia sp. AiPs1]|uniref:hypothetical protein n=1 Tax=Frankia sp. AiPa1 TaxID=573492 RepID=UPI00202B7554|nr:hypothetical protein [Frankia sp. AiPa1]MCL9758243.1 hypothetical protein [Frankia sp. AiPa1]